MNQPVEKTKVLFGLMQDQAELVQDGLVSSLEFMEDALVKQLNKNYDEKEFREDLWTLLRLQETYLQIEAARDRSQLLDHQKQTWNEVKTVEELINDVEALRPNSAFNCDLLSFEQHDIIRCKTLLEEGCDFERMVTQLAKWRNIKRESALKLLRRYGIYKDARPHKRRKQ